MTRPSLVPLLLALLPFPLFASDSARSGPAVRFEVSDALVLSDFKADLPIPDGPRELRLLLPEAITLGISEKRGIPGGGGVRDVPITVYGAVTLVLPLSGNGFDYAASRAELVYTGAQTIRASAPLQPHPESPLARTGDAIRGKVRFPVQLPARSKGAAPEPYPLDIELDLTVLAETFAYTPDPDPGIPPWRSDKSKPSGQKLSGRWKSFENRMDSVVELDGRIGPNSCLRGRVVPGRFSPIGATALAPAKGGGLAVTAFAAPARADHGDSQWAVKLLDAPVDLRKFNGLRLTVRSATPFAGPQWKGPAPVGAAVAIREKGGQWFACRTVTPLLGGTQTWIADLALFLRGVPSPGIGGGPNTRYFLDPSQIDAIAVGVNNPFGGGTVQFDALKLEAVRWAERGFGEPPAQTVEVRVDAARHESFNGQPLVPKGLFGYHVAGKIDPKPASIENTPASFREPPVSGDPLALLRLLKPGSLRPLEHTGMNAGSAGAVRGMDPVIAAAGDAADAVMFTVTNQNLWARPEWMDRIKKDTPENLARTRDEYAAGIRTMFAGIGAEAWDPEKRPESTLRFLEFWNEPFMWARHINRGNSTLSAGPGDPGGNRGRQAWDDPTQFTYIPAKLGGEMYAHFFNAAHDGLAETNPHVRIGGISGPAFLEEYGEHLRRYWMPFLELSKDRVDFLTEHHYQGDPESFAAGYETVTAHTLAKLGKAWPIWNTEANDLQDIAPGDERSAEAARAYTQMNRAYYNYRDILELIRHSRDKAAGRAIHALWAPGVLRDEGEFHMYRLTADLRGTVVSSESSEGSIIPIAAQGPSGLAIYMLNDSPHPRSVVLHAQRAIEADSKPPCLALSLDEQAGHTAIEPVGMKIAPDETGVRITFDRPMRPREIRRVLLTSVAYAVPYHITQNFADLTLAELRPGTETPAAIQWRKGTDPAQTVAATLRVVTRDVQEGEAALEIDGTDIRIPLPPSRTNADSSQIQEIPLNAAQVATLKKADASKPLPIRIRCDAAYDGFALMMASLNLHR